MMNYNNLINFNLVNAELHGFHLVRPAPWPILTSLSIFEFSYLSGIFLMMLFSFMYEKLKINKKLEYSKIFTVFLIAPSNCLSQVPATKVMASIVDSHHDLMFYLIFFTVFVF